MVIRQVLLTSVITNTFGDEFGRKALAQGFDKKNGFNIRWK
jgi:hypothetical protein